MQRQKDSGGCRSRSPVRPSFTGCLPIAPEDRFGLKKGGCLDLAELFTLRRLDSFGFNMLDFSPDGSRLTATTGDNGGYGQVQVWSLPRYDPAARQKAAATKRE